MDGDTIPPQNRVARLCKQTAIDEQGRVTGPAFALRETDESLSVNWIEYLGLTNIDEEISALWVIYRTKFNVRRTQRIAVLKVGKTVKCVQDRSPDKRLLEVLHKPDLCFHDFSHAGIFGYSFIDGIIAELIAQTVSPEDIFAQL